MKNNRQRNLTRILFAVYFLILVWILLFKMSFSLDELYKNRSINLIPFMGSVVANGRIYINEIIDNILVFIPIGIYICMLKEDWSILRKISVGFFISLGIEVLQFILAIGATDITDLLGNTLGGIIGIGVFYLFSKLFKNKTNSIINILALIATILLLSMISILLLAN
ncbi:MAG: VanZ family protein [Peptostreptococcaceae bacterium]|nr:VanZ family protein [Peptostreptococcaceae bacterium]